MGKTGTIKERIGATEQLSQGSELNSLHLKPSQGNKGYVFATRVQLFHALEGKLAHWAEKWRSQPKKKKAKEIKETKTYFLAYIKYGFHPCIRALRILFLCTEASKQVTTATLYQSYTSEEKKQT